VTPPGPASLALRAVDVTVAQREILHGIDLSIPPGELVALLGPTGSGKSALLRAVAGFDRVSAGGVWMDDREITHSPPDRRGAALLLQSFPLWPHMSIGRNVAFGLRRLGLGRREVKARVQRELANLGLAEFAEHRPWQLSGAQRQRAALARTLVAGARLELLDEPFSAQDAQLRARLLRFLRLRQQQAGNTLVFSTSDPDEALRFADRIALLHAGELQQFGRPSELYDTPRNRFVAEYLGNANLIDGEIELAGDQALFRAANGIVIPLFDHPLKRSRTGTAMFRPGDLRIVVPGAALYGDQIRLSGLVAHCEFRGETLRYSIDVAGHTVWLDLPRRSGRLALDHGDPVELALDPARIRVLEG
jgi:iron(III) transport system ATP-binding protein